MTESAVFSQIHHRGFQFLFVWGSLAHYLKLRWSFRMQLNDLNEWDRQVRTVCARVIKELSKMAWWERQVNAANCYQGAVPHENWTRFHLFKYVILRYCKVKRLSSHIVDFHIRRLVSDMERSSVKVSCLFKQYFVTSRVNAFFLIQ